MAEQVYDRAPLVEVIAEVHWSLKQLHSAPNAWIDPYFDLFRDQFLAASSANLPFVEQLVPKEIPVEFVANQPHLRLRPEQNGWPLVQIGPGILTVNAVPPYDGWSHHRDFLNWVLEALWNSYPLAAQTLKVSQLHLRYIDAFDDTFGLERYSDFVSGNLGIANPIRKSVVDSVVADGTDVTFAVDSQFQNKSPEGSIGRVRVNRGQANGKDAVIVEFHCDSQTTALPQVTGAVGGWFDEAHATLHTMFDQTISDDLKGKFGRLVEIDK
jgi:uncharacterized protein (TIGR04255 family)